MQVPFVDSSSYINKAMRMPPRIASPPRATLAPAAFGEEVWIAGVPVGAVAEVRAEEDGVTIKVVDTVTLDALLVVTGAAVVETMVELWVGATVAVLVYAVPVLRRTVLVEVVLAEPDLVADPEAEEDLVAEAEVDLEEAEAEEPPEIWKG